MDTNGPPPEEIFDGRRTPSQIDKDYPDFDFIFRTLEDGDYTPIGVSVVDPDGIVSYINQNNEWRVFDSTSLDKRYISVSPRTIFFHESDRSAVEQLHNDLDKRLQETFDIFGESPSIDVEDCTCKREFDNSSIEVDILGENKKAQYMAEQVSREKIDSLEEMYMMIRCRRCSSVLAVIQPDKLENKIKRATNDSRLVNFKKRDSCIHSHRKCVKNKWFGTDDVVKLHEYSDDNYIAYSPPDNNSRIDLALTVFSAKARRDEGRLSVIRPPSKKHVLIYVKDGLMTGYLTWRSINDVPLLGQAYVRPRCRREGIGKELMDTFKLLKGEQVDRYFVDKANENGKEFVQSIAEDYDVDIEFGCMEASETYYADRDRDQRSGKRFIPGFGP